MSGRNRGKVDRVKALVAAGLNVLADKPWVLQSADLPTLEAVLADADRKGVVAYDIMTERFEVTSESAARAGERPGTYWASIASSAPTNSRLSTWRASTT